jgi:lysophospholipase L1-like esterase
MNILVFGDSIAYGAWDPDLGGWVNRLRTYLDERVLESNLKEYFIVYNLGISGDDSNTLLKRFEREIKARTWDEKDNIIILAIGANDCMQDNKSKRTATSSDKFKQNIEELTKKAKKYSDKVFIVGITPVDESKVSPFPWDKKYSAKNELIDQFNTILQAICSKNKVQFIDICQEFNSNYMDLFEDGEHPNRAGHICIFECVKEILEKEKIF